jgi:hypothetical protein
MNDVRHAAARALAEYGHKLSKKSAGYAKGMPERHCGICQYFENAHHCRIVDGPIAIDGWCKYFDLKVGEASGAE